MRWNQLPAVKPHKACCNATVPETLKVYSSLNPGWGRAFPRIQVSGWVCVLAVYVCGPVTGQC